MTMYAQAVDKSLVACDITSSRTKRLGESPHENVDRPGVDTEVVSNTTAVRTEGSDGVRFVDEKIKLPQNGQLVARFRQP